MDEKPSPSQVQTPPITENLHPRPVEKVAVHILEDEMVLYFPGSEVVLAVNQSARAVWELCDGQNSVRDIIRILSDQFGEENPEFRSRLATDVNDAITLFHQHGYLVLEHHSQKSE